MSTEDRLDGYPERCAVCDDKLENPHPDDPPVCGAACRAVFFADGR